jgi:hypothetical protein
MSRSLIDQKEAFLRTQIRILSTPFSPSADWREFGEEPEDGDLPEKVVKDVLQKCERCICTYLALPMN